MMSHLLRKQTGFTLIEMAIVLMIVGLLLSGLLVPLSAQMEQRNITDTQKSLSEIKEALIGFALTYGRLPCPATSSSNGAEQFVPGHSAADGQCSNFYNGYVPAATLGLSGTTDSSGFLIDSWGNRIHYAVTNANGFCRIKFSKDEFTQGLRLHTDAGRNSPASA